jgi:signal transduction histidine kinase/ActR/RegA family two-component response regulator
MSIRSRLLALVALATLLPGLLFGVRFLVDRDSTVDQAVANLSAVAEAIALDLKETIQGTAQLHYGLARARDLDTRDRPACSSFLSAVREEYPRYTGILTIDPDGRLFCDSLRTGRELDLNDRRYVAAARRMQRGVALEPTFGRLTGLAVLQIAHPARAPDGELKFILLASLNLTAFAEQRERRGQDAEILFFDASGTILVRSPGLGAAKPGGSMVDTELFRRATASTGQGALEAPGMDGTPHVWALAPLAPEIRAAGLHILVGRQKSELVASANRRLGQEIGALAAISLLLFAGVWALAELSLRRQVGRIAAMATKLGLGELDARIPPPHPRGELGQLMAILNRTAESLERQRDAIEELNQRLRQTQRMDAVGQLTGGIAHDFNNLLTVILGNASMLAESLTDNHRLLMLAEMTSKAAERGAELTSRLLAFARRQPLTPVPTDVNRRIAGMDDLLRRTLGEHVEIETVRAAGLWQAMVDPGQLENAILNLCINARDAMAAGGRLTIETANVRLDQAYAARHGEVEPGQYVMVAVSDTGTGMDEATLERAFEPFFTTKEVGKGSGLGLSMVYGFVKQSRGHVRIYSEPGHGTTVKLYLPRADAGAAAEAEPSGQPVVAGGQERILVVEDEDLVREHVTNQLRGLGYDVVAVRNGPEAMAALRRGGFGLLFTDVVMPGGMSGRQLADEARSLHPDLPVLFTSGYTENAIVHHGRLDRGVHLLQKPYRRQDLAASIRQVLAGAPR